MKVSKLQKQHAKAVWKACEKLSVPVVLFTAFDYGNHVGKLTTANWLTVASIAQDIQEKAWTKYSEAKDAEMFEAQEQQGVK